MTTPSPEFTINGGAKASVASGSPVQCLLSSVDGVRSVSWSVIRTDELSDIATWIGSFVISGSIGQQLNFNTPNFPKGIAAIIQCEINGGIDPSTGYPSDAMRATGKVYVPSDSGLEVLTAGELADTSLESNPIHGAVLPINTSIRTGAAGPASSTDNAVPRFDGTSGKTLQGSKLVIADDGYAAITSDGGTITTVGAASTTATLWRHLVAHGLTSAPGGSVNLIRHPIENGQVAHASVRVTARDLSNGDSATYERKATYEQTSGVLTLIGSVTSVHTSEEDAGWDCTLSVVADTITCICTGDPANSVAWDAWAEILIAY